jgi:hypothetical protein
MNFDKAYLILCINKNTCTSDIQIAYEDKRIRTAIETKYLGLFTNNTLLENTHRIY